VVAKGWFYGYDKRHGHRPTLVIHLWNSGREKFGDYGNILEARQITLLVNIKKRRKIF
jgi:hypothetical protein